MPKNTPENPQIIGDLETDVSHDTSNYRLESQRGEVKTVQYLAAVTLHGVRCAVFCRPGMYSARLWRGGYAGL